MQNCGPTGVLLKLFKKVMLITYKLNFRMMLLLNKFSLAFKGEESRKVVA